MDENELIFLSSQIRANSNKPNILTLSKTTLIQLISSLSLVEEQSTSFNVKHQNVELLKNVKFLSNYITQTPSFKLCGDYSDNSIVTITLFKNLTSIEFYKIDLNVVKGLSQLRRQLQKIICHKTFNSLCDVLSKCGSDQSVEDYWTDLKEITFIGNNLIELDESLKLAPVLHTLDLSHNEITNIEFLSYLPNLKYVNLAFNRLEVVSLLKGQICNRLQNLILKNNFIEDISGLRSLTSVCLLDLSNNCLVDHKSLIAISHLATLQWLNLISNPLSFHPNHRTRSACYLHMNTSSVDFILDNVALSQKEKKLVGSYHPHEAKIKTNLSNDSINLNSEKNRKIRHVIIEEESTERTNSILTAPQTNLEYLETKKQIEDLHKKYGESWLNSQSGLLDVLGFENFSLPSGSPYDADFAIYSDDFNRDRNDKVEENEGETVNEKYEKEENINEEYEKEETVDNSQKEDDVEEESIYVATIKNEQEPIFLVIGQTHLSEREISTSNEREKWHLDSIITCEIIELNTVQIDFETMRKDKKQRIYIFDEEIEEFVGCVKNKLNTRIPKKDNDVKYQCMKCNSSFVLVKSGSILGKEQEVKCPNCDSTLVIEDV